MSRRDLFRECNEAGQPVADFQAQWCSRCVSPECSRSTFGQSRFDLRVGKWEETLFTGVPRMSPEDPRYNGLAGKRFVTLDTGRIPEIRSNWVDPRDISRESAAEQALAPVAVVEKAEAPPAPPPAPPSPPAQPERTQPQPSNSRVPSQILLANTPTSAGIMLPNAPPASPPKDPWATPAEPKASEETVVPVGGRIKMGG